MAGPPGGYLDGDIGKSTYELALAQGGPRVPDVDDLGGCERVDFGQGPDAPDRPTMPNAPMDNLSNLMIAQREGMSPRATVWVVFIAGAPTVIAVRAMSRLLDTTSFTISLISAGLVQITWAPGVLPAASLPPRVTLNAGPGAAPWGKQITGNANGVEVHTALDFMVDIF